MIKVPARYKNKCEAIQDGSICDNDEVNYIVDLKPGYLYMDEYTSYPCETWKEVLDVLKYSEKNVKLYNAIMGY